MIALVFDLVAGFFIAKYIKRVWLQIVLAIAAGIVSSVVANMLMYLLFSGTIMPGETIIRIITGFIWHPLITLIGLWYFRRKFAKKIDNLLTNHSMMQLPNHDEIMKAIVRGEIRQLLNSHLGDNWHKRGDPRTTLGVTLEDFRSWVSEHGIPKFILQEGRWDGDNHFVISEQAGKWLFGFAERGTANLWSTHPTVEEARDAAVVALWKSFESEANPSHISGGVASGSPFA